MPLPLKPETIEAIVTVAREHAGVGRFQERALEDLIVYLDQRKGWRTVKSLDEAIQGCMDDHEKALEIHPAALVEAVRKLAREVRLGEQLLRGGAFSSEPRAVHLPHATRVAIVQEARRIVSGDRSGGSFPNHTTEEVAGAIVDLADILIATKEELQKAQNRRPPEPRMSPEKVVAEVLQHGFDAVNWIEPPDLVAAVIALAKAPAKDNEVLTDAHMEGVRILATAVKKLWPDLADEVVKRWMQYKAGEQQYLNELLEVLRK